MAKSINKDNSTQASLEGLLPIEVKNEIPVVDSRLVAEALGVKHKALMATIQRYQAKIEEFGSLPFETEVRKRDVGATTLRFCYLNENQAIFLGTLSRNTKKVVAFKSRLVQSFAYVRKTVQEQPFNQRILVQGVKKLHELAKSTKETRGQVKLLNSYHKFLAHEISSIRDAQDSLADEIAHIKAAQASLQIENFNPLFTKVRKELGQMMQNYSIWYEMTTQELYQVLYKEFTVASGQSIYQQAKMANKTPIEWLESTGWILEAYGLAIKHFGMPEENQDSQGDLGNPDR
ncbi:Rha family transcriptional regulator [uncultured Microscilla sp.]|uniref:Rha family transcriptional regulator n=1 Tax=uncultured Microscilla sp. TaxID=432653 RepID=UPI00260FBC8A|nr:Rha family transcriptional regulator [uncultured Microscilla sp.]